MWISACLLCIGTIIIFFVFLDCFSCILKFFCISDFVCWWRPWASYVVHCLVTPTSILAYAALYTGYLVLSFDADPYEASISFFCVCPTVGSSVIFTYIDIFFLCVFHRWWWLFIVSLILYVFCQARSSEFGFSTLCGRHSFYTR